MSKPASPLVPVTSVPLYAQIKDALRVQILDGTYAPHSQMPSEHELCAMYGVSRITVRQALGDLQKEGLLFKLHGKGTFVSKPKAFQNVSSLQGFAEAMSSMGYEIVNQLRSFRVVEADRNVAARLGLEEGAPVTEIHRVRLLNRERTTRQARRSTTNICTFAAMRFSTASASTGKKRAKARSTTQRGKHDEHPCTRIRHRRGRRRNSGTDGRCQGEGSQSESEGIAARKSQRQA